MLKDRKSMLSVSTRELLRSPSFKIYFPSLGGSESEHFSNNVEKVLVVVADEAGKENFTLGSDSVVEN